MKYYTCTILYTGRHPFDMVAGVWDLRVVWLKSFFSRAPVYLGHPTGLARPLGRVVHLTLYRPPIPPGHLRVPYRAYGLRAVYYIGGPAADTPPVLPKAVSPTFKVRRSGSGMVPVKLCYLGLTDTPALDLPPPQVVTPAG